MRKSFCSTAVLNFVGVAILALLLPAAGWCSTYKVLKALYSLDGVHPIGGVVFDAAGNLYGTASDGGGPEGANGAVFMLTPTESGPWSEKALYVFSSDLDGMFPHWNLALDDQGNVYGVTSKGGLNSFGMIFKLSPGSQGLWTETDLWDYIVPDGYIPSALSRDGAGNFYGTTEYGGVHGGDVDRGTAYQLTPNIGGGYTEQILHYFTTAGNDGITPRSNLVQDAAGNFYGTTKGGGLYGYAHGYGYGTVFQISKSKLGGWHEEVIYNFNGTDGWTPMGNIAIDAAGNIYGTTLYGGSSDGYYPGLGTVFELSPNGDGTWTEQTIHTFSYNNNDGAEPKGGVSLDSAGNLWGTTYSGGASGLGIIFEFSPNGDGTWAGHVLHNFSGTDGSGPFCALTFDSAGNVYGTTVYGGLDNNGVVFELTP